MVVSVAISGGKGGVGKTLIATNLAVLLAKLGKRTLLVDADFGMANANVMFGVNPKKSIESILDGTATVDEVTCNVMDKLDIIAGGTGESSLLDLDQSERGNVIRNLTNTKGSYDYHIVDTSAGASKSSVDFCASCDKLLVVIVGEPTSFLDAYSLIKVAHLDYGLDNFGIIVNQASNETQGLRLFKKFGEITDKFITVNQNYIGYVPHTTNLKKSVLSRKPVLASLESGPEYDAFSKIYKNLDNLNINDFSGLKI
ncbi:AAA family ATPase [bacterium]|jgi:flagellar biosynthesis protein FlhG|nr:AAA family ATPase [bacterium]MDA9062242.1 AAA family ATPase [Planktomarina temperata]MDA9082664.1 AAA family ATPase [bacterium]MDA9331800.1 AAA family ATPase [bacterium]MDB2690531.1 AAA family ATPase [Planktomarina temperata]